MELLCAGLKSAANEGNMVGAHPNLLCADGLESDNRVHVTILCILFARSLVRSQLVHMIQQNILERRGSSQFAARSSGLWTVVEGRDGLRQQVQRSVERRNRRARHSCMHDTSQIHHIIIIYIPHTYI